MQYLIIPVLLIVGCSFIAVVLLTQGSKVRRIRIFFAVLALCISHTILGLGIATYKELDDNSYFAASTSILLKETLAAIRNKESDFDQRLEKFIQKQHLSYETRGNLLENARAFSDDGKLLRKKSSSPSHQ